MTVYKIFQESFSRYLLFFQKNIPVLVATIKKKKFLYKPTEDIQNFKNAPIIQNSTLPSHLQIRVRFPGIKQYYQKLCPHMRN